MGLVSSHAASGLVLAGLFLGCAGGYGPSPAANPSGGGVANQNSAGLLSAVAGDHAVRLEWDASELALAGQSFALFAGTDPATLFQTVPIALDPVGSTLIHAPLVNGVRYAFGLGIQAAPGQYERLGAVLRARPGPPIYVDPAGDPNTADGLTPATAFPDPISGVLTAQIQGGGNVWLRGGDYAVGSLPLFPSVDLYGGFGALFALDGIDRATNASVLHGAANQITLWLRGGNPGSIVDGITIDNEDIGLIGFEADDTDAYLRQFSVLRSRGHGIKFFTSVTDHLIVAQCVGVRSTDNGAEGLFAQGPYQCDLERCVFAGNVQEGAQFDDLQSPDGVNARLRVRGSSFTDNGSEGLQADLSATPLAGPAGSTFQIEFENSTFEENGAAGLLIDIDFELVALWSADISLRGLVARANAGSGVHLDLDWQETALVQRLLSSANGGDGLLVTSESRQGIAVVSSSALVGNGGFGLHAAQGQVALVASHCIVAGNQSGGFSSDTIASSAASCALWLQPAPYSGVNTRGCVAQNDPAQALVVKAPSEYLYVVGANGVQPILSGPGQLAVGDAVELGDDGIERRIGSLSAAFEVGLDPAPGFVPTPSGLARFQPGPAVIEDYALAPGSIASGAGMAMPGATAVDAGIFGSPSGGSPGFERAPLADLFRVSDCSFGVGQPVATGQVLQFGFRGGSPDAASINATSVRVLGPNGNVLSAALSLLQGELVIAPPVGGWPNFGVNVIEIHGALHSSDGRALAAPLAIPFTAQ